MCVYYIVTLRLCSYKGQGDIDVTRRTKVLYIYNIIYTLYIYIHIYINYANSGVILDLILDSVDLFDSFLIKYIVCMIN